MQKQTSWLLMAAMTVVLTACAFAANNNDGYANNGSGVTTVIPQWTVIPVTLDQTLSSATNHKRDTFTVTVRSQQDGDNELPRGTQISGVISDVQRKANGQPGMLDVTFRQALLPDGQKIALQGSLVSLDEKSVNQTSDGRIVTRNTKSKDRLKFIAIGTGAGLIIGKLTDHTLLGGVIGAVAGYIYSDRKAAKSVDVTVKAGTVFGVQLDRELAFKANRSFATARDDYRRAPHVRNYPQEITVSMNGRAVALGNSPAYQDQGNVFIPLTPVMNAARTPFTYDNRQQTVLVNTDQGELYLKIGKSYALLQGEKETLEAPAVVQNGEVFVTPNYLALATNMRVLWDADARTVVMSYGGMSNLPPQTGQDITVTLKGRAVALGASRPFLVNGAILVPLAPVMDAANVAYAYDERRQNIRVDTDNGALYLTVDSAYALLDGTQTTLETPAQVVNGQVYVPLHFLSLATGLTTRWNSRQQTVTLD